MVRRLFDGSGVLGSARVIAVLAVVAFALGGCKQLTEAPHDAEKLDAAMHASMVRGDVKSIYAESDPAFQSQTSEEKFETFLNAIGKKIGTPMNCKQTSWRVNATTSGTYLYSQCETAFSKNASATESFVWRQSDGRYRLYGYRINSEDLITR